MYALINTTTETVLKESNSYIEILNEAGKLNNKENINIYACKFQGHFSGF